MPSVRPFTHGTHTGRQIHYRRGEPPCQACIDGARAYGAARRRAAGRRTQVEVSAEHAANRTHGTHAGYRAHRKKGEEACADCKRGEARYQARRRAARAEAA